MKAWKKNTLKRVVAEIVVGTRVLHKRQVNIISSPDPASASILAVFVF